MTRFRGILNIVDLKIRERERERVQDFSLYPVPRLRPRSVLSWGRGQTGYDIGSRVVLHFGNCIVCLYSKLSGDGIGLCNVSDALLLSTNPIPHYLKSPLVEMQIRFRSCCSMHNLNIKQPDIYLFCLLSSVSASDRQ